MYFGMKRILPALPLFLSFYLSAQKTGLPLDSLIARANISYKEGNTDETFGLYLQSLAVSEKEGNTKYVPSIYYNLALLRHHQKDNKKSREYLDKSIHFSRIQRDSYNLANCLMLSGILHYFAQQPDSSVLEFRQSAGVFEAIGEQVRAANSLAKVGNILETQGKYSEATPYFTKQFAAARRSGDSLQMLFAHINMATNAYNLKNYSDAAKHQQTALLWAERFGRSLEYRSMLEFGSQIYEATNKPAEALALLKKYIAVNDSVLNSERTRQVAEMEAKYEAEKKEATIAQQQQALQQERFRFWLIAGAFLAALLAGALLFRLTRILRRRNAEKEFLVKEIHHRVKNNLQILSSLLHLQSRQIEDEAAFEAVRESQNRVEAMGLIHQKLYMGDNLAAVDMPDYLRQLGDTLLDSFGLDDGERVNIRYEVEPLRLDVDTAIPLGLIINELLTNSLKYAFPGQHAGIVEVALWKDETNRLCLRVSDNGAGTAARPDPKQSTGFGARLVQMLSQKLGGKPEILEQETGFGTMIRFQHFRLA